MLTVTGNGTEAGSEMLVILFLAFLQLIPAVSRVFSTFYALRTYFRVNAYVYHQKRGFCGNSRVDLLSEFRISKAAEMKLRRGEAKVAIV